MARRSPSRPLQTQRAKRSDREEEEERRARGGEDPLCDGARGADAKMDKNEKMADGITWAPPTHFFDIRYSKKPKHT